MTLTQTPLARKLVKPDAVAAAAIEQAREAAEEQAGDFGVGEHLGVIADSERVVTHLFECEHSAYQDWNWAVTMVRASRARAATVNEVVLLPKPEALLAPTWIPWGDRIGPGDVGPGMLLPTADNDPRLTAGFTGAEAAPDTDPIEWQQTRAVVAELGLGRERVLSAEGRDLAAERWSEGEGGADTALAKQAPGPCQTCAYFVRLSGGLGRQFGACTNEYSPSDARVVTIDHGCGGHSSVVAEERGIELGEPVFDTIATDEAIFN